MKRNIYKIIIILVILTVAFLFYYFKSANETVTWYGKPEKISLSGDFKFDRTDEKGNKIENSHWFWAVPYDLRDKKTVDQIYELLSENPSGTYKLAGTQDEDDCNYYEAGPLVGTCVQSISLKDIVLLVNPEYKLLKDTKKLIASVEPSYSSQRIIDAQCPFYEPDGATYRACLFGLLETMDQEISDLRKDVVSSISKMKDIDNEYQHVFEKVIQYDVVWLGYRDAFCDFDNIYHYGGNGQEEFVAKCKIEEIQKYLGFLRDIKSTWTDNKSI